tara:strand:+ start:146 stop:868 length:723 start_codon:yes stop_codon:yes gene_type:complete
MAIHVNTVYQTVQALANKEQRGYLTPQEFNRFAHLATREIFEQYFYDLNQFKRTPGNSTESSDMVDLLETKITVFRQDFDAFNLVNAQTAMPADVYRVEQVIAQDIDPTTGAASNRRVCDIVTQKDANKLLGSPLTTPTLSNPIAVLGPRNSSVIALPSTINAMIVAYVKKPDKPEFGYIVVNKKPVYDDSRSTHFEFHDSEFPELVYRILSYAGINLKRADIEQAGQVGQAKQIQQEKI